MSSAMPSRSMPSLPCNGDQKMSLWKIKVVHPFCGWFLFSLFSNYFSSSVRCSQNELLPSCGEVCARELSCNQHKCGEICHEGTFTRKSHDGHVTHRSLSPVRGAPPPEVPLRERNQTSAMRRSVRAEQLRLQQDM